MNDKEKRVSAVTAEIMTQMDCFQPSIFERKVREILARELTENVVMCGGDLICRCGNYPAGSGFETCLADGTVVEPVVGGLWDGKLYVCGQCGRIIDQDTLLVTGQVTVD